MLTKVKHLQLANQ